MKKVKISYACPIQWNAMQSLDEKSKFCGSCKMKVQDFTRDTDLNIDSVHCGRFRADQVESINRTFSFNTRQVFVVSLFSLLGMTAPLAVQSQIDSNQTNIETKIINRKTFRLTGTVKDSITDTPLPYANVILKDKNGDIVAGTTTGFEGQFLIEPLKIELQDQDITMEVSMLGYHTKTLNEIPKNKNESEVVVEIVLKSAEVELWPIEIIWQTTGLIDSSHIDSTDIKKDSFKK